MSNILKIASKLGESAIDKAIVTTLSPFVTPFGAILIAKGKSYIACTIIFILLILTATMAGDGNNSKKNQGSLSSTGGINSPNTQSGTLPSGLSYKTLNVPYANQWVNKDGTYAPRNIIDGWEMGWMTCGATASVMIAGYYGKLQYSDDKSLKEYVYKDKGQNLPNYCGYNGVSGGAFGVTAKGYCNQSSSGGIIEYFRIIGLKSKYLNYSFESIRDSIDQGKPIILSIYAPLSHILVIKGYTENGQVIVNDSFGDQTKSIKDYSFSGENAIYNLDSGIFSIGSLIQIYQ
jgi:hypothetical protein